LIGILRSFWNAVIGFNIEASMFLKQFRIKQSLALLVPLFALTSCAPPSPEEIRRLGVDAYNDGNYTESALYLETLLDKEPNNEIAHKYMALNNERLSQLPQAKKQFQWLAKNAETQSERDAAAVSVKRLSSVTSPARPRMICLSTTWCPHSKTFDPVFEKVCADYKDKIDYEIIDIEKTDRKEMMASYVQYMKDKYGDVGVPAYMFQCKHGTVRASEMGAQSESEFRESMKKIMSDADKEAG
jgi:thiol-disulfide isomerase/thioredoxin